MNFTKKKYNKTVCIFGKNVPDLPRVSFWCLQLFSALSGVTPPGIFKLGNTLSVGVGWSGTTRI